MLEGGSFHLEVGDGADVIRLGVDGINCTEVDPPSLAIHQQGGKELYLWLKSCKASQTEELRYQKVCYQGYRWRVIKIDRKDISRQQAPCAYSWTILRGQLSNFPVMCSSKLSFPSSPRRFQWFDDTSTRLEYPGEPGLLTWVTLCGLNSRG